MTILGAYDVIDVILKAKQECEIYLSYLGLLDGREIIGRCGIVIGRDVRQIQTQVTAYARFCTEKQVMKLFWCKTLIKHAYKHTDTKT